MGVKTAWSGHTLELDCNKICETGIPGEETRTMRSSILLLGSMLGRCKQIRIGYPGGCTIGARPVDLHLDAMKKMGVLIRETEGEICGECPEGLSGAHIHFPISSVGATENALLAGVTARGETLLENCALEPEIMHLCHFLQAMGAEIRGIGTRKIWMRRAAALPGCGIYNSYRPDRSGNLSVCCCSHKRSDWSERCGSAGNEICTSGI